MIEYKENYFCTIRSTAPEKEMLVWLDYVGVSHPRMEVWEHPHPLGAGGLNSVACVRFTNLTLAKEFVQLYGKAVYTPVAPYYVT